MSKHVRTSAKRRDLDLSRLEALPEFLRPDEVFKLFRMGRNAGYEAIATGQIPSIRIGRRIFIPRAAIIAMVEEAAAGRDSAWPGPRRCG